MWNASFTIKIIFTTWWAIYIVRVYSLQIIGWNVPEWGAKFHPQDRLFHLMSRDGGNIVLLHPRVEYSTFFIYSVNWYSIYLLRMDGRLIWPSLPSDAPAGRPTREPLCNYVNRIIIADWLLAWLRRTNRGSRFRAPGQRGLPPHQHLGSVSEHYCTSEVLNAWLLYEFMN